MITWSPSRRLWPCLLGLVLQPPLVTQAQAPERRFPGVSWQAPPGMQESEQWDTSTCPGRCVTYEMIAERASDKWPLLLVHEPVVGTAAQFRERWVANITARDEGVKAVFRPPSRQTTSGGVLYDLRAIELEKEYSRGRPTGVILLLIERDGVVVPIELYDSSLEGAVRALPKLSDVAGTVSITPATVLASRQQQSGEQDRLARAMEAGYARGERAQLFMNVQSGVRNTYGLAGMELQAYREENLLAFLPGGVFLVEAPATGYRRLDWQELRRTTQLGRWEAVADGVRATHPDGTVRSYRRVGASSGPRRLSSGGETWTELPVYDPNELVGIYRSVETSTAGGALVGSPTMVASRADSDIELKVDGRFEMSRDSYTAVSGANVAGGTGNRRVVTGRWRYEPASYTITLTPDDGTPVITGPFHGGPGKRPSQVKRGETLDWRVLSGERWWLAK